MSGSGDYLLVSVEQVKAATNAEMADEALEDLILREEAWLARRIGPLIGARTQTLYVADVDRDSPLLLRRPTDEVTVTDGGTLLDESVIRLLRDGTIVERADAPWAGPTVEIAYTPNDELEVERVLIELCRLTVTASPFESERIGEYQYSRGSGTAVRSPALLREDLVAELLPSRGPATARLRSSLHPERIGVRT